MKVSNFRKPLKPKICRICKQEFIPKSSTSILCGFSCAVKYADQQSEKREAKKAKQERKERRQSINKLKTRGDYVREAQTVFNAFIRERDRGLPCISCGRFHNGQYHAGHYRPTSTNPELRYSEINVHAQCSPCNLHLHGNLTNYRKGLIAKVGLETVEWLEGDRYSPAKFSIDDLIEIKKAYQCKLKELKNADT